MKQLTIKALLLTVLALVACEPEYPTPYPTNQYNSTTGNASIMFTNASPNSTSLSLAVDNNPVGATATTFGVKYPASTGYVATIPAGSRNIRLLSEGTSVASARSNINANTSISYFGIGRADVTASARADRARLIEFLAESLPAIPTSTPNTVHVRLLNFGLTTAPVAPATSGGTLGSIALRIDASSPTAAPAIPGAGSSFITNGTYFLPSDQVFPIPAPADGQGDTRTMAKSYASTTSPFTALTVPTVGGAGNNYTVDIVTTSNGNVVLDNVALNLVAGRVYTLALIGSSVVGEAPYQLLVIRHR